MRAVDSLRREKEAEQLRSAQAELCAARERHEKERRALEKVREELAMRERMLTREATRVRQEVAAQQRRLLSKIVRSTAEPDVGDDSDCDVAAAGASLMCSAHSVKREEEGEDEETIPRSPKAVPRPEALPSSPPPPKLALNRSLSLDTDALAHQILHEARESIRKSNGPRSLPESVLFELLETPHNPVPTTAATVTAAIAATTVERSAPGPASASDSSAESWASYDRTETEAKAIWEVSAMDDLLRGPGSEKHRSALVQLRRLFDALEISFLKRLEFANAVCLMSANSAE
jgi:hypothetical protein